MSEATQQDQQNKVGPSSLFEIASAVYYTYYTDYKYINYKDKLADKELVDRVNRWNNCSYEVVVEECSLYWKVVPRLYPAQFHYCDAKCLKPALYTGPFKAIKRKLDDPDVLAVFPVPPVKKCNV